MDLRGSASWGKLVFVENRANLVTPLWSTWPTVKRDVMCLFEILWHPRLLLFELHLHVEVAIIELLGLRWYVRCLAKTGLDGIVKFRVMLVLIRNSIVLLSC